MFAVTWQAPFGKLPGSQRNDPGSPALQTGGSHVLQSCGHTSLLYQQKDLMRTGMAVTCRPAERTQLPFNGASLSALLWGALCKESSCCSHCLGRSKMVWGCTGGDWHHQQEWAPRCPGLLLVPRTVAVPHNQAALSLALKPGTIGEGFRSAS